MVVAYVVSIAALGALYWGLWFGLRPAPWTAFAVSLTAAAAATAAVAAATESRARSRLRARLAGAEKDRYERPSRPLTASRPLRRSDFEDTLRAECERSRRYGRDLTVATVSLQDPGAGLGRDSWEALNSAVVCSATRALRSGDIVGYLGGLEYAFCFPLTDLGGAQAAMARLGEELEDFAPIVGHASLGADGLEADELLDAARRGRSPRGRPFATRVRQRRAR